MNWPEQDQIVEIGPLRAEWKLWRSLIIAMILLFIDGMVGLALLLH